MCVLHWHTWVVVGFGISRHFYLPWNGVKMSHADVLAGLYVWTQGRSRYAFGTTSAAISEGEQLKLHYASGPYTLSD